MEEEKEEEEKEKESLKIKLVEATKNIAKMRVENLRVKQNNIKLEERLKEVEKLKEEKGKRLTMLEEQMTEVRNFTGCTPPRGSAGCY